MQASAILDELRPLGSESYKRVIFKHGVREPCYGVKIGDMQKIVRRIKRDYQLALDLYATGVYDAMYLAGLIADDMRMTRADLDGWVAQAYCRGLAEATVAWVAAGSPSAWESGLRWIDSERELTVVAGWATLGSYLCITPDERLDLAALRALLARVQSSIHASPDLVRYQMNSWVIALGSSVRPLTAEALGAAEQIGPVIADLGDTACQVPFAPAYIRKVEQRGSIGKKRKSAKC